MGENLQKQPGGEAPPWGLSASLAAPAAAPGVLRSAAASLPASIPPCLHPSLPFSLLPSLPAPPQHPRHQLQAGFSSWHQDVATSSALRQHRSRRRRLRFWLGCSQLTAPRDGEGMSDLSEFGGDGAFRTSSGFLLLQHFSLGLQGGDAPIPAFLKHWVRSQLLTPNLGTCPRAGRPLCGTQAAPIRTAAPAGTCVSPARPWLSEPSWCSWRCGKPFLGSRNLPFPFSGSFPHCLLCPSSSPSTSWDVSPGAAGGNPGGTRGFGTVWDCAG